MPSNDRKRSRSEEKTISLYSESDSSSSSSNYKRKRSKKHKHDKKDQKKKHSHRKDHKKRDKKDKKKKLKHHRRKDCASTLEGEDNTSFCFSREQDEIEAKEILDFKLAVQTRKGTNQSSSTRDDISHLACQINSSSSSTSSAAAASATADVFASSSDIASKYGISKGLIRTTESNLSITQKFSKTIFGGDDDNPATRQRMKREHAAQQAMVTARSVIAARQKAAAAKGTADSSDVCNLMNTFRSGGSKS